jgi:hypothetical protein
MLPTTVRLACALPQGTGASLGAPQYCRVGIPERATPPLLLACLRVLQYARQGYEPYNPHSKSVVPCFTRVMLGRGMAMGGRPEVWSRPTGVRVWVMMTGYSRAECVRMHAGNGAGTVQQGIQYTRERRAGMRRASGCSLPSVRSGHKDCKRHPSMPGTSGATKSSGVKQ